VNQESFLVKISGERSRGLREHGHEQERCSTKKTKNRFVPHLLTDPRSLLRSSRRLSRDLIRAVEVYSAVLLGLVDLSSQSPVSLLRRSEKKII